jgi:predicted MPP superfamily phosphohydrolase
VHIEPSLLVTKNVNLFIPNWHNELNGLKVAVISDLHIGLKGVDLEKLETIVAKINKEKPDLVLFLGDFDEQSIQNAGIDTTDVTKILKKLNTQSVSVLGNHDARRQLTMKNMLKNANVKVLEDENIKLNIKGKDIYFVGLKDLWHFKPDAKKVVNQVKEDRPIIVLMHNPDSFYDVPDHVSLILSGHTHGGEVYLPFIGAPFVPSEFGQKFVKGHIIEDNKHIYITSGIGTVSGIRFGNIPEIVILHLYEQNNSKKIKTQYKSSFNLRPIWKKFTGATYR